MYLAYTSRHCIRCQLHQDALPAAAVAPLLQDVVTGGALQELQEH
jgi:hypothetical protein